MPARSTSTWTASLSSTRLWRELAPQEHEQSLQNWMLFFGDVLGTQEIVRRIQPARLAVGA